MAYPSRWATGRRRWIAVGLLSLALVVLIIVMIVPTVLRQQQYATLRTRGVTTTARITYCSSSAGSNQTFAGTTTCPATFALHGTTVSEKLLGVHAQLQTGDVVTVIVDPRAPQDVYPLSDVRTGYQSGWLTRNTFIAVVAVLLLVLTIASQVIVVRRRRSAGR
ncbi:MAG TPA: DUF3592 domain-containing protein [Acidimicrobiales bacterium]|nr:DUF3592 domain-containing protein [Acidimicrobiales bacterium]